jgi:ABC-2 type transport system ATP-binding protein
MRRRAPARVGAAQATGNTAAAGIDLTGLRKSFGDNIAVDGLDLHVAAGSVLALIGPNGSGKTTTVRMLSTLLRPDGGRAVVAGHDVAAEPQAVRAAIGVTGQFSAVDKLLTGRENLTLMARLHHIRGTERDRRIGELLERFDLADAAGRPAMTYSGGMTRRLDLAMTLMSRPRIVFLDEPTTGLDPRGRRVLWQIVRELAGSGVTVLLTTQYLEEADRLANRVALIDHGRLIAEGTPDELKARTTSGQVRMGFPGEDALAAAAALFPDARREDDALALVLPTDNSAPALRVLLDRLDAHGVPVQTVSAQPAGLDEVFLALTGHTAPAQSRPQTGGTR